MTYVDGFVLSVPKAKRAQYKKIATEAAAVWKQCGALDYKECRIDDTMPPWVVMTFPKMAKTKDDEETWFSFIVFESKAARNKVNKAVMQYFDEKYGESMKDMPFDLKRMAYGGFKTEVEM